MRYQNLPWALALSPRAVLCVFQCSVFTDSGWHIGTDAVLATATAHVRHRERALRIMGKVGPFTALL